MFCPKCGAEYRPGFTQCVDCLVPLVDEPGEVAASSFTPTLEIVSVFKSADSALITLAKSLLLSAEIEFIARGEGVQDVIGWGRFPSGLNLLTGPVELQVSAEDAAEARALLEGLQENG